MITLIMGIQNDFEFMRELLIAFISLYFVDLSK